MTSHKTLTALMAASVMALPMLALAQDTTVSPSIEEGAPQQNTLPTSPDVSTPVVVEEGQDEPVTTTGPAAAPAIEGPATEVDAGEATTPGARIPGLPVPANEWRYASGAANGAKFAPFDQITPENAGQLELAWQVDFPTDVTMFNGITAAPIQVGDTLYGCTNNNLIFALDAENGEQRWRFDPGSDLSGVMSKKCRSVSYYEASQPIEECQARILAATVDARLFAIDARSGELCTSFGEEGFVDLLTDMGPVKKGFVLSTSGPTVTNGVAVIGGWISDGQEVGEPSGVVRAFDAVTGDFVWAFDPGNPDFHGRPPEGEFYERGSPNAWGLFSADEENGLVFITTGNATPDYWGAHRSENFEEFTSSVVALDSATGDVRWHFRTVNHDIWDYDVGTQPALVDLPGPDGEVIPALLQGTKRGQVFTFNRLTGEPIDPIEQRPVPQGAAEGDFTAETQPYPTNMPAFTGPDLTEADMWGITPIDQMLCRLEFQRLRYEGQFTPPSVGGSLQFPGYIGGINWGGVSVHQDEKIMIANWTRMPNRVQLIPREEADRRGWDAADAEGNFSVSMALGAPQMGTPFAVTNEPFMSPLKVPCLRPPYGMLTAVDLETYEVLWSRPIGTAANSGPFGIKSGLTWQLGAPMTGGTLVTETGVVVFGGSQDGYIRAVDMATGEELWTQKLPNGASATPMSYVSPSGKQFIVIAASGATGLYDNLNGYLVAYALPD
ncbi:quinoprotein glucose dehydrogenase/quinate dehydrogenase (quinone) [Devosia lucknowensis]|uniref:Quinoprotein glucose dehydrogenase/quinate dehydrogenase (Quinone) n=1 Tax=Devosia lucknowensis TaxID=1096929 RepID=A0A1Y6G9W1_9HYPH|nr:pyrroloquinoline quinone-dependent dehydrogenase [Devosia lucknowensis]SMQ86173.1 quinoprotein glucose dehydrogenase/quinate dehydrogenase (quinone) [Devosia lucknowensis]